MTFKQRLLRYLLGFGIGVLVVFFMFPNYDWLGWVPQKRVMESIREAQFDIKESALCKMQCLGVTNEQIQLARNEGHINFDASKVKSEPRIYQLEYGNLDLQIALTDSTASLVDVLESGKICTCP